jgi:hypothetical protein
MRALPLLRSAVVALSAAATLITPAFAQEFETDSTLSVESASPLAAPEAASRLPAQPEDRGHMMPLHAASVTSWICGDSTVQTTLGKDRTGCYREIYPSVEPCTAQLQEKAPAAQNRATGGRLDVVSFRAAFRACLQQDYAERLAARGLVAPQFSAGEADPLAARMGGAVAVPTR